MSSPPCTNVKLPRTNVKPPYRLNDFLATVLDRAHDVFECQGLCAQILLMNDAVENCHNITDVFLSQSSFQETYKSNTNSGHGSSTMSCDSA